MDAAEQASAKVKPRPPSCHGWSPGPSGTVNRRPSDGAEVRRLP
jgi:hypothetical protein